MFIISSHDAQPEDMTKATPDPKAQKLAEANNIKEQSKNVPGRDLGQEPSNSPSWFSEAKRTASPYKPDDITVTGKLDTYSQFSVGELQEFTISKGKNGLHCESVSSRELPVRQQL